MTDTRVPVSAVQGVSTEDAPVWAGVYLRISKDPEGRELGVGRQREDCLTLCARLGYSVYKLYVDNDIRASGPPKARPQYDQMLRDARAGHIGVIVAYTTGRLTRRPMEHEAQIQLAENYGVRYRYVASPEFDLNTSAGRMIARVLAARDAAEAEDISERGRRQKLQAVENGDWTGGAQPYGYRISTERDERGRRVRRIHEIQESEAAVIRDAARRLLAGEKLASVCRDLTARKVPTPGGSARWHQQTLRTILLRPRNAGLVQHRGQILADVKTTWPPIYEDIETWHALRTLLTDPKRQTSPSGLARSLKWVGSGVYRCGQPGCSLPLRPSSRSRRYKYPEVYRCESGGHCAIPARPLDDVVNEAVRAALTAGGAGLIPAAPAEDPAAKTRAQATALRVRRQALMLQFADPEAEVVPQEWMRLVVQLDDKLAELEALLASYSHITVLAGVADATDPAAAYDRQPIERRRAIVDAMMQVIVLPGGRGGRHSSTASPLGDRVRIVPKNTSETMR